MIHSITASVDQDAKRGHQVQYTLFLTEKCCKYNIIDVKSTDSIMKSSDPAMEIMNKTIARITNEHGHANIGALYMWGYQSSLVWRHLWGSSQNEINLSKLATKEQSEIKRGAHQTRKETIVEKGW